MSKTKLFLLGVAIGAIAMIAFNQSKPSKVEITKDEKKQTDTIGSKIITKIVKKDGTTVEVEKVVNRVIETQENKLHKIVKQDQPKNKLNFGVDILSPDIRKNFIVSYERRILGPISTGILYQNSGRNFYLTVGISF